MYITIWKFQVKPQFEDEFVRAYGEVGEWVDLFRKAPGFIGSELHRDLDAKNQFLTIDRWESESAYESFRSQWAREYQDIDRKCESWTENEIQFGRFADSARELQ